MSCVCCKRRAIFIVCAGSLYFRYSSNASTFKAGQSEIGKYIADFEFYLPNGTRVVEDAKGVRTALYRWKKRHVEAQYGITIVEV